MKKLIFFVLLYTILLIGTLSAAYNVSIREILNNPDNFRLEIVALEGKVIKYTAGKSKSTMAYLFQDDWFDVIEIVTSKELPDVDARLLIKGIVTINNADKTSTGITIFETERISKVKIETTPPIASQVNTGEGIKKKEWGGVVLYGFMVVLILIIAALSGFIIFRKKRDDITSPFSSYHESDTDGYPQPSSYIEDSSIKVAAPPEGTLKVLTGRLEMIAGYDQFMVIRFYTNPSQEETEFTFGRDLGTPYFHFQLKSPTVSPKQAKILWTNKKYLLINYATVNPTKVNGKTLEKDQSVILEDNTVIEMGEIIFKFSEK